MAEEKDTAAPAKRTAGKTGRRKKPEADHAARAAPQDKDTGSKAQEILEKRKELAKVGIHKTNREHHFLYGKVFCGECGAPFLRRTLKAAGGFKTQSTYKAWNCRNRQKGKGNERCGNRFIKEEELIDAILRELEWLNMDQERFEKEVSKVLVYLDHIEVEKN